jgi:hypothetical protein
LAGPRRFLRSSVRVVGSIQFGHDDRGRGPGSASTCTPDAGAPQCRRVVEDHDPDPGGRPVEAAVADRGELVLFSPAVVVLRSDANGSRPMIRTYPLSPFRVEVEP